MAFVYLLALSTLMAQAGCMSFMIIVHAMINSKSWLIRSLADFLVYFSIKFFHFIASQHFEYGSSNGIGTEEDPFDIEIGNDIVWTWIIKNDGEQIATIVDWEYDLFSCSSMLNLSPEYCPGFTSNTMVRKMLR